MILDRKRWFADPEYRSMWNEWLRVIMTGKETEDDKSNRINS